MEKLEYSDLNKFLVSVGVTLIVISVLLPWLYLREPFDLLLQQDQISKLTKEAIQIVTNRQHFVAGFVNYIFKVSVGLFSIGLISIIFGLIRWWKNQRILDRREKAITEKHEEELKKLTEKQIEVKAVGEFIKLKNEETEFGIATDNPIVKETFVPKYIQLERAFFNKMLDFYYDEFHVLSNNSIDTFEYDIILQARKSNKRDYIFEIKYYPKGYNKFTLQDAALRLGISTGHYINKTSRKAKPVLIAIVQRNDFTKRDVQELDAFTSSTLKEFDHIDLMTIYFDELSILTKKEMDKLLLRE